jgi:hypothetical protein
VVVVVVVVVVVRTQLKTTTPSQPKRCECSNVKIPGVEKYIYDKLQRASTVENAHRACLTIV